MHKTLDFIASMLVKVFIEKDIRVKHLLVIQSMFQIEDHSTAILPAIAFCTLNQYTIVLRGLHSGRS